MILTHLRISEALTEAQSTMGHFNEVRDKICHLKLIK